MKKLYLICALFTVSFTAIGQVSNAESKGKPISPNLFGIFYEDISYAADGGLYAELVQNRSFEYSLSDNENESWHPFTAWSFNNREKAGYGIGTISVETKSPIHENNPHYVVLNVEFGGNKGVGLKNEGFDGIAVKAGSTYDFSVFMWQISDEQMTVVVKLVDQNDSVIARTNLITDTKAWKKYTAVLTPDMSADNASLIVATTSKGKLALDMISLFPQNTFKHRHNGMRIDLAQAIAAIHPKFMRFPGGCLVHGDGVENRYDWKKTIGPVEQRVEQRSNWHYHQTLGLGYFEYFQFCEDIGAAPIPIVSAGVSCQNSGGTWRVGTFGQKCIPLNNMDSYIQDIFDLIEYANGAATSTWGAKRVAAGHPEPFNLKYLGVGNEDKQTPEFKERFQLIYAALKAKHPEITVIGTVGPDPDGEDYNKGWELAKELNIPIIDEHYYRNTKWFLSNLNRYDTYSRTGSQVYVGEYASWGNTLFNALVEAAYMTSLERNGDLVCFASYAPLLSNVQHLNWEPDMIYFNNTAVCLTANYYTQQLFASNTGDTYFDKVVRFAAPDSLQAASCVRDSKTGDIILKLVNVNDIPARMNIDLSRFKGIVSKATGALLTSDAKEAKNSFENPAVVAPKTITVEVGKRFNYEVPAFSLTVIRVKTKNK
jgi:alpha-L-arabinofuranosidase